MAAALRGVHGRDRCRASRGAIVGTTSLPFIAFALASAAVVLTAAAGKVTRARIVLGGVGTKPWRSPEAEAALVGQPADKANFRKAAEVALREAKPQSENAFKIELAKRCLTHALQMAAKG